MIDHGEACEILEETDRLEFHWLEIREEGRARRARCRAHRRGETQTGDKVVHWSSQQLNCQLKLARKEVKLQMCVCVCVCLCFYLKTLLD